MAQSRFLQKLWKRHGYALTRIWLRRSLAKKWVRDRRELPLTDAHRELYQILHVKSWNELGYFPELIDCRDYNDKIQWLKLFDQSPEIVQCSDKIAVRDFVRARVGASHLVEVYQTASRFSDVDFGALPDAFVLKTNHDSGSVVLVREKGAFNRRAAKEQFEKALGRTYGWRKGEWSYSLVPPQVLVEAYIDPGSGGAPPDFKFHCVNGKVRWLQYIYDRGVDTKEVIVSAAGEVTSIHLDRMMSHSESFERPAQWNDLLRVAEALAEGFKYVRVDLYLDRDHIYFGELTFFPRSGCYGGVGQRQLGPLLDFDRSTFEPPLLRGGEQGPSNA
jgi:hypothetical protein